MKKLDLSGEWKWKRVGDCAEHIGHVPGSVYSDMLQNGLIDDPFWRTNEYGARELMMDDYAYARTFIVSAEDLRHDSLVLVCEGLDTIADIMINGRLLASVYDMHRTYRFPVKALLAEGEKLRQRLGLGQRLAAGDGDASAGSLVIIRVPQHLFQQ